MLQTRLDLCWVSRFAQSPQLSCPCGEYEEQHDKWGRSNARCACQPPQ